MSLLSQGEKCSIGRVRTDCASSSFALAELWSQRQHWKTSLKLLISLALPHPSMEEGLQALQENKAEIQAARADAAVQELCSLFPWTAGNAAQAQCCRG